MSCVSKILYYNLKHTAGDPAFSPMYSWSDTAVEQLRHEAIILGTIFKAFLSVESFRTGILNYNHNDLVSKWYHMLNVPRAVKCGWQPTTYHTGNVREGMKERADIDAPLLCKQNKRRATSKQALLLFL